MIVAGFGFRETATEESLRNALAQIEVADKATHCATVASKAESEVFQRFARSEGATVVLVANDVLEAQQTITKSEAAFDRYGTGSVAEAAALAAAGPNAKLLAPRVVSADRKATCAIAMGADQ